MLFLDVVMLIDVRVMLLDVDYIVVAVEVVGVVQMGPWQVVALNRTTHHLELVTVHQIIP